MAEVKAIADIIKEVIPNYVDKDPEAEHTLIYNSASDTLEPIYFFVLDLMNDFGLNPEKLVDSFTSTPGSPIFSETGIKASRVQDEAMKILGSANTVLKSIMNIIYDLRDFNMRLKYYDQLKSQSSDEKEASLLALKQIWMDKVDINKGNSSIKAMAMGGQMGAFSFQTLIDAFLIVKDEKDVANLDLNDRVKRVVKSRITEFLIWLKESENELRKRYEIEKTYLRSQVNSLKLYSRWAKPYLKAAEQLRSKEPGRDASLVNMFNTLRMELTLLGKSELKPGDLAASGDLPQHFGSYNEKGNKQKYYSCYLVDFKFTAIPRQGTFVGKTEITFRSYALNENELKKLDQEIDKSEVGDMLKLIEGSTTEGLDQLQKDIDFFLGESEEVKAAKEETNKDQSNPFLALIGFYNKKPKKEEKKISGEIKLKKDDWYEKEYLRKSAAATAEETCFTLFDIYKKANGMVSYT